MHFYFIRHGQTDANALQVFAGSGNDHPLNEAGHYQAQELSHDLNNYITEPISRIISSGMRRALQTAEYIVMKHTQARIEVNHDFREWDLGDWEGKSSKEMEPLLLNGTDPVNGETRKDFYMRIEKTWTMIHNDKEPYVIVAHGGVWLAFQDFLKIPRFKIGNCQVVRVHSQDGIKWKANILNLAVEQATGTED